MSEAIRRTLRSAQCVVLIGTDCPALTGNDVKSAFDALAAGKDFVFQPAEDGGYVLVGARRVEPRVFQRVPWSTAKVMVATRQRLRRCGLTFAELPSLWDVDDPADLQRARRAALFP